jgi:hypothetical protein
MDGLIRGNSVEESTAQKEHVSHQTGSWTVVACRVYRKRSSNARALRLLGSVGRRLQRANEDYAHIVSSDRDVFGWIHEH